MISNSPTFSLDDAAWEARGACKPSSVRSRSNANATEPASNFTVAETPTFDEFFANSPYLQAEIARLSVKWSFVSEHDQGETVSPLGLQRGTWVKGADMHTVLDINDSELRAYLNHVHGWIMNGGYARGESSPVVPAKFQPYCERLDGFVGELYGLDSASTGSARSVWSHAFRSLDEGIGTTDPSSANNEPRDDMFNRTPDSRSASDPWWNLPFGGLAWSATLSDSDVTRLVQSQPDHPFFQTTIGQDRLVEAERADYRNDLAAWQLDSAALLRSQRPGGIVPGEPAATTYLRAFQPFDERTYADLLYAPPQAPTALTSREQWALQNSLQQHLQHEFDNDGSRIFASTYAAPVHNQNRWLQTQTREGAFDPVVATALANPIVRQRAGLPTDPDASIDAATLALYLTSEEPVSCPVWKRERRRICSA